MSTLRSTFRKNSILGQLVFLTLFSVMVTCLITKQTSLDKGSFQLGKGLDIHFAGFSPAYAAFEDEYLFDYEQLTAIALNAGQSDKVFSLYNEEPKVEKAPLAEPKVQVAHAKIEKSAPVNVQPQLSENKIKVPSNSNVANKVNNAPAEFMASATATPEFRISLGSVTTQMVAQPTINGNQRAANPSAPSISTTDSDRYGQKDLASFCPVPEREFIPIQGSLELVGGLAFLGALEVSWVVDGEEIERGQIDMSRGQYEIYVQALEGEIIVSLYDEDDYLMGEGVIDLDKLATDPGCQLANQDIAVKAIDQTLAGKIRSAYSLGSTDQPVQGASISLYGMGVSTQTGEQGDYHFSNWQSANSKTVAMASKSGYWDSLFIIDSNKVQDVLLFPNRYMKAFFDRLTEMGFDSDVSEQGIAYGMIKLGKKARAGLRAEVPGYRTVYFQSYFAMEGQKQTDNTGLFAIPGLDDGDHQLYIYDGKKLVDQQILVVEAGKVAPVVVDLKRKKKKLQFFDPLDEKHQPSTGSRFFDGEYTMTDEQGQSQHQLADGVSPALLEYAMESGDDNNMLVSRTKSFEKIPILNQKWFQVLKNDQGLKVEQGLAVGFIDTQATFSVEVAEGNPDKIMYFNTRGQLVERGSPAAVGFILVGLERGLHTLMIGSADKSQLYMTDLLYSDHQSISIIFKEL